MKQMGNYNFTFSVESDSTDELPKWKNKPTAE
jgi:hypothetical protein